MGVEKDFFETEGLALEAGPTVFGGTAEPGSLDLPEGSLYLCSNGSMWKRKLGVWVEVTDATSGTLPEFIFADDQLVIADDTLVIL
jgi:hypothetical protein